MKEVLTVDARSEFPYRLVIFLEEGRMMIARFKDRHGAMRALGDAERAGRSALALEVFEMAHGGDEGAVTATNSRRRR